MEAKELRIGNYLSRLDGSIFQVNVQDLVILEDIKDYLKPKPIPLTEEWLLGFGAKKANDSFAGYVIIYPNGNGMRIKNNEWNNQHLVTKIEFVHQLQNLYYSLTNEELILT